MNNAWKRRPAAAKGFGGPFLAVDHGEDERDLGARLPHGLRRLQGGAAGGGDVLDHGDALAGKRFVLGEALDQELGAMLLRLLAHEEGVQRIAAQRAQRGDGAGDRHRAQLQPPI